MLRAAKRLRVAQPALSRQMGHLEREIGVALFARERHGVRLTPAGEVLLQGARFTLNRLDEAVGDTRRADRGVLGTVQIGITRGPLDSPEVGIALQRVRAQLPDASLVLIELAHSRELEALRSGDVDLVITIGEDRTPGLRVDVLYSQAADNVLIPDRHQVNPDGTVDPARLREEPAWFVATLAPRLAESAAALGRLGLRYEIVSSAETALALVFAGRGWVVIPRGIAVKPPSGTQLARVAGLNLELRTVALSRADDRSRLLANVRKALVAAANGRDHDIPLTEADGEQHAEAHLESVELRQLRALTVAFEERSVTRAARRLGLSQSTVSRQLLALERVTGCALVQRPLRDVAPTSAGKVFAVAAQAILTLVESSIARSRRVARGITGTCIIGSIPKELTNGWLDARLAILAARHREVAFEVSEMYAGEQPTALLSHRIDVGVVGSLRPQATDPALISVQLTDDPIECVLIAADHPLAGRAWINAREICDWPFRFIARAHNARLFDAVTSALADLGVITNTSPFVLGARVLWTMLAASQDWSVVPRSFRAHAPRGLVAVPLEGLSIPWGLNLLWRRDESDETVRKVLAVFRERAQGAALVP